MLSFDLGLLNYLFAVHGHFVVVAARGRSEHEVFAGFRSLEGCCVPNAAWSLVFRTPPLRLVIGNVVRSRSFSVTAEVFTRVCRFLQAWFPMALREDFIHLR